MISLDADMTTPKHVAFAFASSCLWFSANNPASAQTWIQTSAPITNWTSVSSSADGSRLVAAAGARFLGFTTQHGVGLIYTSADSGATWTATSAPSTNWTSVASSADGAKLVAVAGDASFPGPICISTNHPMGGRDQSSDTESDQPPLRADGVSVCYQPFLPPQATIMSNLSNNGSAPTVL